MNNSEIKIQITHTIWYVLLKVYLESEKFFKLNFTQDFYVNYQISVSLLNYFKNIANRH